jgi:hypothetical protein
MLSVLNFSHLPTGCALPCQMHFLISSMSPLGAPKDLARLAAPRSLDQVSLGLCSC